MEAFASVEDYEKFIGGVNEADREKIEVRLVAASAFIRSQMSASGVEIDPTNEVQAACLKNINISVVFRSMNVDESLVGLSQWSQTAGSFTGSGTNANPNGDFFLTAQEKKTLGIAASGSPQKMFSIRAAIHKPGGDPVDGW